MASHGSRSLGPGRRQSLPSTTRGLMKAPTSLRGSSLPLPAMASTRPPSQGWALALLRPAKRRPQ
eukprot:1208332-Alexandrium_andersonii.AAC.1